MSQIKLALATRPNLSGKTVNDYATPLREALQMAVDDGVLPHDPAAGLKRAKHRSDPPDPFSIEQVEKICACAQQHDPEQVWNFIEPWLFSGPRTSESQGLKWPLVGLARGEVATHEALVRGRAKGPTNTATARTVRLNRRALAAIRRQKRHTFPAGEHVFHDPRSGQPWHEQRPFRRSDWTPMLEQLGIRHRRPYRMRHTCASMLLMAGAKPGWWARQTGRSVEKSPTRRTRSGSTARATSTNPAWSSIDG